MQKTYIMVKKLSQKKLEEVASKLKAIAHPTRIAIMNLLERNGKMNVTEIYETLGMDQATTSHHLNVLKTNRVLTSKRDGKKTYYSVRPNSIVRITDCISKCETR